MYQPLYSLGRCLREAFCKAKGTETLTLDVNSSVYLFGEVNKNDACILAGAFKQYIEDSDFPEEIKKTILASPIIEEKKYHVTLLYPSGETTICAADMLEIEIPENPNKKQRSQLNTSVMRTLRTKYPTVEMTVGDAAFFTTDGHLAAIELVFTSQTIFTEIDPKKVFHITLTYNRDVEERAPVYSNTFLEKVKLEQ